MKTELEFLYELVDISRDRIPKDGKAVLSNAGKIIDGYVLVLDKIADRIDELTKEEEG